MKFCKYSIFVFHVYLVLIFLKLVNSVSLFLFFVFLILFNACKYFKRPLGNQLPKCVEGLPFLNNSHNNNNNNLLITRSLFCHLIGRNAFSHV